MKSCFKIIGFVAFWGIAIGLYAQAPPGCPANGVADGETFVVTDPRDWPDQNNSNMAGTFRWAIAQANKCRPSAGNTHRIVFDLPGPGPHVLKPYMMYPRIQSAVEIDGFSQPGASPGNPQIVIDGEYVSVQVANRTLTWDANGNTVPAYNFNVNNGADVGRCFEENYDYSLGGSGDNIVIRGLVINNFQTCCGLVNSGPVHMNTGSGFVIEGCYIGTDHTGTVAIPNHAGITINSPQSCTDPFETGHIIGSTDPTLKNIIAGNDNYGLQVMKTQNVQVLNNYIGVGADGSPLGNGGNGVSMYAGNTDVLFRDNWIANNDGHGVAVWDGNGCPGIDNDVQGSRFEGNTISDNALNGMQFLNTGVYDHVVGVDLSGTGSPNIITGNGNDGIYVAEWKDQFNNPVGGAASTITIRLNSISCNNQLTAPDGYKAINLEYSEPNPGNNGNPAPVINGTLSTATTIVGTAPPNQTVDVYQVSNCSNCISTGSTQGDSRVYLGTVMSDGAGDWTYNHGSIINGQVAATATDASGNTSEFSTCIYYSLPVDFLSFDAKRQGMVVELDWITISEVKNDFFAVERSADGTNFETIGYVDAVGNSSKLEAYDFTDFSPLLGVSYYRIRQVDVDGSFDYSVMKVVSFEPEAHPSAFINNTTIYVNYLSDNDFSLVVTDVTGKIYFRRTFSSDTDKIVLGDDLANGMYIALLHFGNVTETIKLQKLK